MAILATLTEHPMHAYRMHELIKERGKDGVVNVAQRNSVYQTIERLLRAELIRVDKTMRAAGRPKRAVYAITSSGISVLREWLGEMLAIAAQEFPKFPAALSFVKVSTYQEAQSRLERRVGAVESRLAQAQVALESVRSTGLSRLSLIEEEYKQAMAEAELEWVGSLLTEVKSGAITWNAQWLREVAAQFGGAASA